jgi:light-regulated signal transduction histidine kinase (bacteriophytochrome)
MQRLSPERSVQFRITEGLKTAGDAVLIGAALRNLMENAWKFTGLKSDALIEVGVNETENGNSSHSAPVFFVRDNGVGFDMAYASKMFAPFQRLHSKADFPGTGIGLATVQRIFQRHGGRIWAESAVDQGATFYFTLNQKDQIA